MDTPIKVEWKKVITPLTGTHVRAMLHAGSLKPPIPRNEFVGMLVLMEGLGYKEFYVIRALCGECLMTSTLILPSKATEGMLLNLECVMCHHKTAECIGDEAVFEHEGVGWM